jgi:hypothetical protein
MQPGRFLTILSYEKVKNIRSAFQKKIASNICKCAHIVPYFQLSNRARAFAFFLRHCGL